MAASTIKANCDALGIVCRDVARSLAFYRALGLDIPEGAEKEPHIEVEVAGGFSIMFDPVSTITSFDEGWTPPNGGPGMALAFGLGSPAAVDEAYATMTGLGFEGHKAPWDAVWGQRYASLRDPDGNGVDLYAPLG